MNSNVETITRIHFFKAETGLQPRAPLVDYDGYLYGTTLRGGLNDLGTIFRMKANGKDFKVIYHFGFHSYRPAGGLVDGGDGYLYGTTTDGNGNNGAVYKVKPDGSELVFIHTFSDYYSGMWPVGELLVENGFIYGVTSAGGTAGTGRGLLYKLSTNGSSFTIIKHFNQFDGAWPTSGVVSDGNGTLYGFLPYGGEQGYGSIYRVKTDGTGYEDLYEMIGDDLVDHGMGFYPVCKPVLIEDELPASSAARARQLTVDVYPNPTVNSFTLRAEKNEREMAVELMDFSGMVVYRNVLKGEDLKVGESLPRGMYVLKITDGKNTSQQMLIKK
jgi:uncharacterized repeat protein (TIGR03803 family)